jgi:hypothetical protein
MSNVRLHGTNPHSGNQLGTREILCNEQALRCMNNARTSDPALCAVLFAEKMRAVGYCLDFSLKSLSEEVDKLLESKLFSGRGSEAEWQDEAGLEAYVGETLSRLFDGQWIGSFREDNPGPNYYLSWVQFGEAKYFPSMFLSYRISNGKEHEGTFEDHLVRVLPRIKLRAIHQAKIW